MWWSPFSATGKGARGSSAKGALCGFSKFGPKAGDSVLSAVTLNGPLVPSSGPAWVARSQKPGCLRRQEEQAAALGCPGRRCQEALLAQSPESLLTPSPGQLSAFIPNCFRDRACPATYELLKEGTSERTTPLCPTPYLTSLGRICSAPQPNGPGENKSINTLLALGATDFSSCCN